MINSYFYCTFYCFKNDMTKFLWGRLEGFAPTSFWPWGRSPPSPHGVSAYDTGFSRTRGDLSEGVLSVPRAVLPPSIGWTQQCWPRHLRRQAGWRRLEYTSDAKWDGRLAVGCHAVTHETLPTVPPASSFQQISSPCTRLTWSITRPHHHSITHHI